VKDLNGKVNSILEFNPKLQVIVLDEWCGIYIWNGECLYICIL
jgi:hypothetical protein